jgi:hypothetical protein
LTQKVSSRHLSRQTIRPSVIGPETPLDPQSRADLSSEDFSDLDVLEDVIWTRETTWPPGVAGRLLRRSREIRPGVYQVRGHGERDPLSLVTVV